MATLGGYVKAGELPRDAAVREIREELGRECQELRYLGKFRTDANRGFGSLHAFAGEQCAPHAKTAADVAEADKEQQQQLVLSEVQLRRALLEGKFREVMRHPAGAGAR